MFHIRSAITMLQQLVTAASPTLNQIKGCVIRFGGLIGMQADIVVGVCSKLVLTLLVGLLACAIDKRSFEGVEGSFVRWLGVEGGSWRVVLG